MINEQAFQKLKHYCAYQERCHREVENKLYELKVAKSDHPDLLSKLIEDGYLNEERFAIQFAGGKFRMKQWGRRKIMHALKEKQVSEYCIKKALKQISNDDYMLTLEKLAKKKIASLKGEPFPIKKKKTIDHLLQKGFEGDLAVRVIDSLQPAKPKKK